MMKVKIFCSVISTTLMDWLNRIIICLSILMSI